jgi:hypothetical protein
VEVSGFFNLLHDFTAGFCFNCRLQKSVAGKLGYPVTKKKRVRVKPERVVKVQYDKL